MRGRPGCPTEQEKKPVGATVSNPPVLQGKVGYQIAPSSAPVCALGHLWFMVASPGPDRTVPRTVRPPRGRLWAVLPFPSAKPPPPSPPSWGAGRYGRWFMGRRPGRKKEDPRLQTRVGSPEGRTSPLWPSFPPFLGRNGGPRRVGALRGAAPRGLVRAPTTRRVRSTAPPKNQLANLYIQ